MSWWSSSEIEKEILKATSSSIPSGEQDLALNLEISDSVRSKQASAVEVLRVLRKRLYDRNPNVQILALHLLDLLVKNGGLHFLAELTKKDFIDAYVAQLMSLINQERNPEVIELMLEYFQTWALASQGKAEANYLQDKYAELKKRRDINFPEVERADISSSFLESATAPEWTDSDTCMKSGQPFTFYNRKHHCRNCGGVFLQEYCSNFRPLPHFGINIPVRVCDDCDAKLAKKYDTHSSGPHSTLGEQFAASNRLGSGATPRKITSNNRDIGSKYQDDLEQAIRLSLQGSRPAHTAPLTAGGKSGATHYSGGGEEEEEEMDEDLRRAIESSLAEMNQATGSGPSGPSGPTDVSTYSSGAHNPAYAAQKPPATVADEHRETIEAFYSSVQTANPREATYNPALIEMNRKGIELQPKIVSELRLSSSKLATLEDLHGKLLAVANYYDALLEAELNPDLPRAALPNAATGQETDPNHAHAQEHEDSTLREQHTALQKPQGIDGAYGAHETQHETRHETQDEVSHETPNEASYEASYEAPFKAQEHEAPGHEQAVREEPEPEPEPVLIEL